VPRLARDIGGIQRPHIASPRGTSFDIGRIAAEDRSRIPLTSPRPLLLQPSVQNADTLFDDLGLQARLRAALRERSVTTTRGAEVTYVEAEQLAGAIRASGSYKVTGRKLEVSLALVRDTRRLATVRVAGSASDLDALARAVADRIIAEIGASARRSRKPVPASLP